MRGIFFGAALAALVACSACNGGGPPADLPGFAAVTAGKFKMGYEKGRPNEKPEREVECDHSFYIGKTEVTNEDYLAFVNATKRAAPPHWEGGKFPEGEAKRPVTRVTWEDARLYCEWKGGRLPTEVEWEYAARGKDGRLYPWGNEWAAARANNFEEGKNAPVDVGSFPDGKGPFGTLDQAGNAWEWTATPGPDPSQVVIKGGSYAPLEDRPRASLRGIVPKVPGKETVGFRMAKDAE